MVLPPRLVVPVRCRLALFAAACASLGSCASHGRSAPAPVAAAIAPDSGIVLAVRPVAMTPQPVILAALGDTTPADRPAAQELILRDRSGAAISVVQSAAQRFSVGERVTILRGPHTKVIPTP